VKDKSDLRGMVRGDAAIHRVLIREDIVIHGSRPALGFRGKCVGVEGSEVQNVLNLIARKRSLNADFWSPYAAVRCPSTC
jgi:hypothetical protein